MSYNSVRYINSKNIEEKSKMRKCPREGYRGGENELYFLPMCWKYPDRTYLKTNSEWL
jgi:hypothetical protein